MGTELEGLRQSNDDRMVNLARQGAGIAGLDQRYIRVMLETLLGDDLKAAQLEFEKQRAEVITTVEKQHRMQRLLTPQNNGVEGHLN